MSARTSKDFTDAQRPPRGLLALLVLITAFGVYNAWFLLPAAWAEATTLAARYTAEKWRNVGAKSVTPLEWATARKRLEDGITLTPDNPNLHAELAFLYVARAQAMGKLESDSVLLPMHYELMDLAIEHYRTAAKLRLSFPYTWAHLALAKHYRGQHDDEMWQAFDQSIRFGRSEAGLQPLFAEIAFAHWPTLAAARQKAVIDMIALAKPVYQPKLLEQAAAAGVQLPGIAQPAP